MERFDDQRLRPPGTGFAAYRAAVRRQWPLVALVAAAAVAMAIAYAALRSPSYQATATLVAAPVAATNETFLGIDVLRESADGTRTMQTAAAILDTRAAAARAGAALGRTTREVEDNVTVAPEGQTNLIDITATDGSATGAARLANAYVAATLFQRRQRLSQQAAAVIDDVRRQLDLLPSGSNAASVLQARLPQLAAVRTGTDPTLSVGQRAAPPTSHSGTPLPVLVIIAAILGLLAGTGVAVWADSRRKGGTYEELVETYPIPVLAQVPIGGRRGRGASQPHAAEAYRAVLAQLGRRARGVLLVTSAGKDDGSTAVAVGLATAAAESGRRVALLDLDLRHPAVGDALGLADDDRADPSQIGPGAADLAVTFPEHPGLRVLALRAEPLTGLRLEAALAGTGAVIEELAAEVDLVIIDTAPLGAVSDALRLTERADDIVVVSRPNRTQLQPFARMRDLLERTGNRPAGMVVVGEEGAAGRGYGPAGLEPLPFERPTGEAAATR